jgi:hypothetical protein
LVDLVIALRPQTPKNVRGGWSHYTDTSEPVDGNEAQNMVTVQSGFELAIFQSLAHELTKWSNRASKEAKKKLKWLPFHPSVQMATFLAFTEENSLRSHSLSSWGQVVHNGVCQ